MPSREGQDWTVGPAKWAAVFVLGGVSALGITASFRAATSERDGRGPAPMAAVRAEKSPSEQAPVERSPSEPLPAQPLIGTTPLAAEPARDAAPVPTPARTPGRAASAPPSAPPAPSLVKINLNTASAAELERLPRIGPAMAKRIIEFRTTRGPFRHIDDLDAVPGIGPRTLEQLRPLVGVE